MLEIERPDWRCSWLDILRTTLAAYVVVAHAIPWAASLNPGQMVSFAYQVNKSVSNFTQPQFETNIAVLAFIVLSGYCIHRSGFQGMRAFMARRFFRIYPVYVAASVLGVAVFVFMSPDYPALKVLSSTNNISIACAAAKLLALGAVLPSLGDCSFQGNAPLRTVAAEMWLYACYPIGLLILRKYSERALWLMLAGIAAFGFYWSVHAGQLSWWNNDSFAGFLLFWWLGAKALDRKVLPLLLGAFPLALVTWIAFSGDPHAWAIELRQISVALMVAAILPLIDRDRESSVTEILGQAGYSIYAFHAPIVASIMVIGGTWQLALVAAFTIGLMADYAIERPFNLFGKKIAAQSRRDNEHALSV